MVFKITYYVIHINAMQFYNEYIFWESNKGLLYLQATKRKTTRFKKRKNVSGNRL